MSPSPEPKNEAPVCILCRRTAEEDDGRCRFHTGSLVDNSELITGAIVAWGAAGNVDPEAVKTMQENTFTHSCCKKFSMVKAEGEELSLERGCREARAHLFSADILCIVSDAVRALVENEIGAMRAGKQFNPTLASFDDYRERLAPNIACVVIVTDSEAHDRSAAIADEIVAARPDIALTIFADPANLDGWRLQAASSEGLTAKAIEAAVVASLRQSLGTSLTAPMPVFLSYTRTDLAVARFWAQDLANGVGQCWADWDMLPPGAEWSNAIVDGIAGCKTFVLLLTDNTPEETYCWKELHEARKAGARIRIAANGVDAAEKLLNARLDGFGAWRPVYLELELEKHFLALVEETKEDDAAVCIVLEPLTDKEASSWGAGASKRDLATKLVNSGSIKDDIDSPDIDTFVTDKYLTGRDWRAADLKVHVTHFERLPPEEQKAIQDKNLARHYREYRQKHGWIAEMHWRLDNYYLCRDNPDYHDSQVETREDIFADIRRRHGWLGALTIRITDRLRKKR